MKFIGTLLALAAALSPLRAQEVRLFLDGKGIGIDAGAAGTFVVEAPKLMTGNKAEKPAYEVIDDKGVAKYASGGQVEFEILDGEARFHLIDLPDSATGLMFSMPIPIKFKDEGKYAFGNGELKAFPEEKGGQFIEQGDKGGALTVVAPSGDGFVIDAVHNWYGLQDNRVFNWPIFAYNFLYDLKLYSGKPSMTIRVEPYKP